MPTMGVLQGRPVPDLHALALEFDLLSHDPSTCFPGHGEHETDNPFSVYGELRHAPLFLAPIAHSADGCCWLMVLADG